jgi:putative transposase
MIDQIKTDQEVSIRRSIGVLGFRRQTYYGRKEGHRPEELDAFIADLLHQVTNRFLAWGFWMVFHFLRRQGHPWNHKRVYRIWKQEALHLRLPPKRAKVRRKYLDLIAPDKINQGWAMDFVSDWVVGPGQEKVRIINIIDECSRKALWTEAYSSISATTLIDVLDKVVAWRGTPAYIRCDNGPEFISGKLEEWADKNKLELRFIQPGKPSQNGLVERLNGTLRKECLNLEWFVSLPKLNEQLQEWWQTYNTIRPHSSIGYQTPDELELLNQNLYFSVVAQ